jgi:hypothetical protein
MIDWYLILFLAAGIIVFNLNRVAEHRSSLEYLMIGKKLGMKQGTILMWISFFGGTSLLIPIYFVYHFGLLISIVYYIGFLLFSYFLIAHFTYGFQAKNIREPILTRFYQTKFTAVGYRFFLPLIIFANMDGLLLQLSLASKVFGIWFPQQSTVFVALLLIFCVITAGLGGMLTIYRTVHMILLICGFAFLFVPLYLYLKDGIHSVFQSYNPFEKHKDLHIEEMMILFVTIPIASIGMLVTNSFQWQVLQSIKANYRIPVLKLSIFCSTSIPVSVMIYVVYMVSKHQPRTFSLLSGAIVHISPRLITLMIVLIWLAAVVHSVAISLYSMATIFLHILKDRWQPPKNIRVTYFLVIILSFIVFVSLYWLVHYIKFLFITYLLFYLTVSFPLWMLLRCDKKYSFWIPISMIALWAVDVFVFLYSHHVFLTIKFSIISSIICAIGICFRKILKIGKISQKLVKKT